MALRVTWSPLSRTLLIFLACAGVASAVGVIVVAGDSFRPAERVIVGVWVAAPIPIGAWVSARFVDRRGTWLALGSLAVALVGAQYVYWDAFLGPTSRRESLGGLVVLPLPALQIGWLVFTLAAARYVGRQSGS
jgi:hypothetical protein